MNYKKLIFIVFFIVFLLIALYYLYNYYTYYKVIQDIKTIEVNYPDDKNSAISVGIIGGSYGSTSIFIANNSFKIPFLESLFKIAERNVPTTIKINYNNKAIRVPFDAKKKNLLF